MPQASAQYEPESFEDWFAKLPFNPALMAMIHQMYQLDQFGKANEEVIDVKLMFTRKGLSKPISVDDSFIDKLSDIVRFNLVDNVIKSRDTSL